MFKRFFSIAMLLCAVSRNVVAKEVLVKGTISNEKESSLLNEAWEFCSEKTAEVEELVKTLSAKSKEKFDNVVEQVKSKLSGDSRLQEAVKKYRALCDKYGILRTQEPKFTLHWLTQDNEPIDLNVPQDVLNIENLKGTLPPEQLDELRASAIEITSALQEMAEKTFEDLKDSELVQEFKKNSNNKTITIRLQLS